MPILLKLFQKIANEGKLQMKANEGKKYSQIN